MIATTTKNSATLQFGVRMAVFQWFHLLTGQCMLQSLHVIVIALRHFRRGSILIFLNLALVASWYSHMTESEADAMEHSRCKIPVKYEMAIALADLFSFGRLVH